ncbi:MAG: DUF5663 domain-containing protein [Acidobacteriota bacterium]|jgi:hypothetical protein|nr:DUF5663 domain-containing protein [Acidobacteriota bacterium]
MLLLDDQFLADCGLESLPTPDKKSLLQAIYKELELRVGEALSEGLSAAQLDTFAAITAPDEAAIRDWLSENTPDYLNDELFHTFKDSAPAGASELDILGEYAAMAWLRVNAPNYPQITETELKKLKAEVISRRDELLG